MRQTFGMLLFAGLITAAPVIGLGDVSDQTDDPARQKRLKQHEQKIRELIEERKKENEQRQAVTPIPPHRGTSWQTLLLPDDPQKDRSVEEVAKILSDRSPDSNSPKVTLAVREARLAMALSMLSEITDTSISSVGRIPHDRITLIAKDLPLEEALDRLANENALVWWKASESAYHVGTAAAFLKAQGTMLEFAIYPLGENGLSAEWVAQNTTPAVASAAVSPTRNLIALIDLPHVHQECRAVAEPLAGPVVLPSIGQSELEIPEVDVTIACNDAPAETALKILSEQAGIPITPVKLQNSRVTVLAEDRQLGHVLEMIRNPNAWDLLSKEGTIYIGRRSDLIELGREWQTLDIEKAITLEEAEDLLRSLGNQIQASDFKSADGNLELLVHEAGLARAKMVIELYATARKQKP